MEITETQTYTTRGVFEAGWALNPGAAREFITEWISFLCESDGFVTLRARVWVPAVWTNQHPVRTCRDGFRCDDQRVLTAVMSELETISAKTQLTKLFSMEKMSSLWFTSRFHRGRSPATLRLIWLIEVRLWWRTDASSNHWTSISWKCGLFSSRWTSSRTFLCDKPSGESGYSSEDSLTNFCRFQVGCFGVRVVTCDDGKEIFIRELTDHFSRVKITIITFECNRVEVSYKVTLNRNICT